MSIGQMNFRGPVVAVALAAMVLSCVAVFPALAQKLNFSSGGNGPAIEVLADDGIEWVKESQMLVARGNAKALRGDTKISADELRAYYRAGGDGTQIWRLDAVGNVTINAGRDQVFGDVGVFDMDNSVFVMTGKNLRLIGKGSKITARDSLEYWTERELAVARGNAQVINNGKKLKADILTAQFEKAKSGGTTTRQINAFGNVTILTDQEVVTAEKGVYSVASGIATLSGAVKMTRGNNQLNGCSAQVNLNTNVSKLFSCKGNRSGNGAKNTRVQGLLSPNDTKK